MANTTSNFLEQIVTRFTVTVTKVVTKANRGKEGS